MAAQGYIGRAPGESSVIVARQTFTPTGITTNFTFASGYEIGYVDAYLNGARLIEGSDYTATDGSVVGLTTHAINGDVLELVAYKAFNLANVTGANGDFVIPDKIVHKEDTDTAIRFPQADTFTVETAGSEVIRIDANGNVGIGTTNTLKIADPKNQSGLNVGFITANSITAAAGSFGSLNVSGTLSYEDVANQDVVGFATFQKGIIVQGAGSTTTTLNVTGVGTITGDANFGAALNIPDAITHVGDTNTKIRFPAADTFTVETSGSERLRVDSLGEVRVGSAFSVSQAGVVTATSFFGSGAGLTGVASTDNINTSTLAQFTGGVGIADSIFHIGDSDTAIRFPAANTFTVETAGSERVRVDSAGNIGVGGLTNPGALLSIPAGESNTPRLAIESAVDDNDFTITQYEDGNGTYTMLGQNVKLNVGGNTTVLDSGHKTAGILLDARSNGNITFYTGGDNASTEKLRIDSSGNVIVNGTTTGSSAKFEVRSTTGSVSSATARLNGDATDTGAINTGSSLLFAGHDGGNASRDFASIFAGKENASSGNYDAYLAFGTRSNGSTLAERLRITSNGTLLIGATAAVGEGGTPADLNSTEVGRGFINIARDDTAAADHILFGKNGAIAASVGTDTTNTIVFKTGTTERIRIGASGQIGIGGANFGTSGQVLSSGGASGTVTWEDVSSGGITTTAYSPAANATIQIGLGTAQHHELTLSAGITTVTTTGGAFGESHSLVLIQPSSGICTVGFSTFFKFPSGSTPSMSEGGSKVDLISFVVKNIARNVGTGATELLASAGLNYN